jgi:hypothetical protein
MDMQMPLLHHQTQLVMTSDGYKELPPTVTFQDYLDDSLDEADFEASVSDTFYGNQNAPDNSMGGHSDLKATGAPFTTRDENMMGTSPRRSYYTQSSVIENFIADQEQQSLGYV